MCNLFRCAYQYVKIIKYNKSIISILVSKNHENVGDMQCLLEGVAS